MFGTGPMQISETGSGEVLIVLTMAPTPSSCTVPGYFDTIFGSVQILQQAIVEREVKAHPPDIYVKPDLRGFRTLQFYKADEIYRQAQPAKEELKRKLAEKLQSRRSQEQRN